MECTHGLIKAPAGRTRKWSSRFWIARSEKDAAEYCRPVDGESRRLLRIMLERNRGRIRDQSTKEDGTAEALQRLKGMNTDRFEIEQLADNLGLKKIHDIAYRWPSLHVHGKSFRAQWGEKAEGLFATVTALASFVAAIILIAYNRTPRNQATDADSFASSGSKTSAASECSRAVITAGAVCKVVLRAAT